ncbi:hypothetical protein Prudu_017011, partial [Prunus dulcis]
RRSTRDPPPGHSKLPRHHVKIFGFSQNTGETLPNFRQKSKGIFKRNLKREGGCWRRLRAPMATGPVALEPPSSPLPFPTDINPGAALSWPENRVFRRRFVRSYPNFQLEILPRFSTKLIEHQELGRSVKETFEGSKGDSAEFSAEV